MSFRRSLPFSLKIYTVCKRYSVKQLAMLLVQVAVIPYTVPTTLPDLCMLQVSVAEEHEEHLNVNSLYLQNLRHFSPISEMILKNRLKARHIWSKWLSEPVKMTTNVLPWPSLTSKLLSLYCSGHLFPVSQDRPLLIGRKCSSYVGSPSFIAGARIPIQLCSVARHFENLNISSFLIITVARSVLVELSRPAAWSLSSLSSDFIAPLKMGVNSVLVDFLLCNVSPRKEHIMNFNISSISSTDVLWTIPGYFNMSLTLAGARRRSAKLGGIQYPRWKALLFSYWKTQYSMLHQLYLRPTTKE